MSDNEPNLHNAFVKNGELLVHLSRKSGHITRRGALIALRAQMLMKLNETDRFIEELTQEIGDEPPHDR